ncbi:MAG: c-type cytochrome [Gallionella sp.]
MKSIIVSVVATAGLLAAGGAMAIETPDSTKKIEMPGLAKKLNCTICHSIDKKVVGPAWKDVAKKYHGQNKYTYNGKEYPLIEGLVMKVSKGGSGNWGSMPMPANDPSGTKQAEITELINFEQSLWDK